jgi:hypothetical protein
MEPFLSTKQHVTVVHSQDPAVTLKPVREARPDEPEPPRQDRRPGRWLPLSEVESVLPQATQVVIRPIDSDEAFDCSGGVMSLNDAVLARAYHRASTYFVAATYGPADKRVTVMTDEQRAAFLKALPLVRREELGQAIFDESAGLAVPFVFRG